MHWQAKVFQYCERGASPAFWAEPLNAVSNGAFILAALASLIALLNQPRESRRTIHYVMIAIVFAIGVGSFLFHTVAERWSILADVLPISLFMVVYLATALSLFVAAGWLVTGVTTGLFVLTLWSSGAIAAWLGCSRGASGGACLNGSIGYLPALLALLLVGAVALARARPEGAKLLLAGAVFAVSLTLRTLDLALCEPTRMAAPLLGAGPHGTHFLWHLLNALTLYFLLRAAIDQRAAPGGAIKPAA